MKDKVEIFSDRVHHIAAGEDKVREAIEQNIDTPLESFVRVATFCLQEMDEFLLSKEEETEETALKYMNDVAKLAQIGMAGYCYALGIKLNLTHVANQMVDTYKRKNADYGDSFGASIDHYGPVAAHIRISDKISRLCSLVIKKNSAQVKDESIADTFLDLACYAIMRLVYIEMKSAEIEEEKEDADE